MPDELAVRLFCCLLFMDGIAQTVGYIVREPSPAELLMRLEPPHGEFADVQLRTFKVEEKAGEAAALKRGHVLERRAVQQDSRLRERFVDAVYPARQVGAALKDDPLAPFHPAQVVRSDLFDLYYVH